MLLIQILFILTLIRCTISKLIIDLIANKYFPFYFIYFYYVEFYTYTLVNAAFGATALIAIAVSGTVF